MPEFYRRDHQEPKSMSSDDLVACYGLAVRLRAHEPALDLDMALEKWLPRARKELESRGELDRIRELLPVYYDPTRRDPVFGPGAAMTSLTAIRNALQPAKPVRAIAG